MNRETFISQVLAQLQDLSNTEREEVRSYFDELIQDKAADSGISEEQVIASLGAVEDIAREVRDSASQNRPAAPAQQAPNKQTPQGQPAPKQAGGGGLKVITAKASQVRNIAIRVYNQQVVIEPGHADQVELRYEEDDALRYDFSLEGGVMRLNQHAPVPWTLSGLRFLFAPGRQVTLSLPRDFAGELDAQTCNASIQMQDIEVWGNLRLKSSNGALHLARCAARDMDLKTSNHKVAAEDLKAKQDISLRTSNGALQLHRATSGGTLTLRSSNGRLNFSGLEAKALSLQTSNGAIKGSLPHPAQEYSVTSSTSNGSNNLRGHDHQGPRPLSARTSNGAIKIQFEG